MSKLLYVHNRLERVDTALTNRLSAICDALVPDNLTMAPQHTIRASGQTAFAVAMSNTLLTTTQMSVLLGCLYEPPDQGWEHPGTRNPDGNYVIVRAGKGVIEFLSDAAATRTLWYYLDDAIFVASTSQRAIVMYLGSFVFDDRVLPWLLSTGTLGPELSWDARFKRLQADSSLILDTDRWTISVTANPVAFTAAPAPVAQHRERLRDAISTTMRALSSLDLGSMVLPLSGGYDSRSILCFLDEDARTIEGFKAVTWGLEQSLTEPGNDAKIAVELASVLGVKHEYHHTDVSDEPIEAIIDRFIRCGEGRIDHLSGYMDGMEVWRHLHDTGVCAIIRGDEGFGSEAVSSELTMKQFIAFGSCADYENLAGVIDAFGLPQQEVPEELARRPGESLASWRDRLFLQYRLPTGFAALSDIKSSYVEPLNPLLSKTILRAVQSLPDHLRTEKKLFRTIVRDVSPEVPFATKGANASPHDLLKSEALVKLMKDKLSSDDAQRSLGTQFIDFIVGGIKDRQVNPNRRSIRSRILHWLKSVVPRGIRNLLSDTVLRPKVDGNELAFRVYIIVRMQELLRDDARLVKQ